MIPSLKYSVLGSALAFTKGRTATESIVSPPLARSVRTSLHGRQQRYQRNRAIRAPSCCATTARLGASAAGALTAERPSRCRVSSAPGRSANPPRSDNAACGPSPTPLWIISFQFRRILRIQAAERRNWSWLENRLKITADVAPGNGSLPVAISYSTTPNENRSVRASSSFAARLLGRHVRHRTERRAGAGQVLFRHRGQLRSPTRVPRRLAASRLFWPVRNPESSPARERSRKCSRA